MKKAKSQPKQPAPEDDSDDAPIVPKPKAAPKKKAQDVSDESDFDMSPIKPAPVKPGKKAAVPSKAKAKKAESDFEEEDL